MSYELRVLSIPVTSSNFPQTIKLIIKNLGKNEKDMAGKV